MAKYKVPASRTMNEWGYIIVEAKDVDDAIKEAISMEGHPSWVWSGECDEEMETPYYYPEEEVTLQLEPEGLAVPVGVVDALREHAEASAPLGE